MTAPGGGYIVTWSAETSDIFTVRTQQVQRRRLSKNLCSERRKQLRLNSAAATVTMLSNGNYVVSWLSSINISAPAMMPWDMTDGQMDDVSTTMKPATFICNSTAYRAQRLALRQKSIPSTIPNSCH